MRKKNKTKITISVSFLYFQISVFWIVEEICKSYGNYKNKNVHPPAYRINYDTILYSLGKCKFKMQKAEFAKRLSLCCMIIEFIFRLIVEVGIHMYRLCGNSVHSFLLLLSRLLSRPSIRTTWKPISIEPQRHWKAATQLGENINPAV